MNWITSAQRFKTVPEIENMIMLVYSHKRLIVLNSVLKSHFQVHWVKISVTCVQSCIALSFVVAGRSAVGRN